jgi:plastocyanin
VKAALVEAGEALGGSEPHRALAALESGLAREKSRFDAAGVRRVASALAALKGTLGRTVEVRILDHAPYFDPQDVSIHRGDTVQWKYDPPSDGHAISHALHRVAVGAVVSRALRAGESFTHRFDAPGEFSVRNLEKDGQKALAVVRVAR